MARPPLTRVKGDRGGLDLAFNDYLAIIIGSCIFILLWFIFQSAIVALVTSLTLSFPTAMAGDGVTNLTGFWWAVPAFFLIATLFWSLVEVNRRKRYGL